MAFLGETNTQTISNSRLAFIFLHGLIIDNQTGFFFQCPTPIPMWVPDECSFETLKSRMHNTLWLTNDQFLDEIYYKQPSIDAVQQSFFHSLQLKNDDNVCTMLMCNEQYPCIGLVELLCIINRTPDDKIWNSFRMLHRKTQGCHQTSCTYRGSPLWNSRIITSQTIVLSTTKPYKIFRKINRISNNRVEK